MLAWPAVASLTVMQALESPDAPCRIGDQLAVAVRGVAPPTLNAELTTDPHGDYVERLL